jgi:hypothetical protein
LSYTGASELPGPPRVPAILWNAGKVRGKYELVQLNADG